MRLSKRIPTSVLRSEKYSSQELVFLLIAVAVALRLLPHPPNVVPLGALAIWGGFRLKPGYNYFALLGAMLISDLFLGFHATMGYVYGSLLITTWLASRLQKNWLTVGGTTLAGAVLFFLVTNFGAWAHTNIYPHTMTGLLESYIAALPFFRASLTGDMAYTIAFFGLEYVALTLTVKRGIVKQGLRKETHE